MAGAGSRPPALSCEVSVVDVEALIAINGGAREVTHDPQGWDAANAVVEWTERGELLEAVRGHTGLFEPPTAGPGTPA